MPEIKNNVKLSIVNDNLLFNKNFGNLKKDEVKSRGGFVFSGEVQGVDLLDDIYKERLFNGLDEKEYKLQSLVADNQRDADIYYEDVPIEDPANIEKVSDFDGLLRLAGKFARLFNKNPRVNYRNLSSTYDKEKHGLCPQGTISVVAALTGSTIFKSFKGHADNYSFKSPTTGGAVYSLADSGFYNDKIRILPKNGSWTGTYIKRSSMWQIGDVVANGYRGYNYGHIQVWTGYHWVSDFKQGQIQVPNKADIYTYALWRLNERGLNAVREQSGRLFTK